MCDTLVVVEPGRVWFAKNSDRDPDEAQGLEWHAAADHPPGATVRCTHIEIAQVPRTHAVLISRPSWMWGAEMGANEHGVAIGNEAVFTDQPYAATGLTGMDLLRLALERAATAEAAAETIVELLERHGQGGRCGTGRASSSYHSSFLIADPGRAIVLETAGQRWASEAVGPGVRTISNGLTIPAFAAAHADRRRGWVNRCAVRQAATAAGARADAGGLMALLRSHGPGDWPRYSLLSGGMGAPCMHAGGLLAGAGTTASLIAELTPQGARLWGTGTAAPCLSLFKPASVTAPPPDGEPFDETLFWAHERLHRAVMRDPARAAAHLPERDALEQAWLADPPDTASAYREHAARLERWTAAITPPPDRRPWFVRRYWGGRPVPVG